MGSSAIDPPDSPAEIIGVLEQGRRQFLALVGDIRPELLRYCARMTGSVADGEDVVQDTLARAYYELSQLQELPPLRPWLFRIAHHRAIDLWRRETLRVNEPIETAFEVAAPADFEPENALARAQAVHAALSYFVALAPAQRGCVILKDVLGHSLDEIAAELNLSLPAVKAALHRGRAALRQATATGLATAPPATEPSPALRHYAKLFNACDWEGVRSLLADEVRLDLVSQRKAAGRRQVARYFTNYARTKGWRLAPAWFDGREVLAVLDSATAVPSYFIMLDWLDGRVVGIRDFRYVTHILQEGEIRLAEELP